MRSVDAVPPSWRPSAGAAVLAIALPMTFLHVRFQPSVSMPAGATLKLQDAAILAVGLAAVVRVARDGIGPLRCSKWIWVTTLLFIAWIVAATLYPTLSSRPYAWRTHAVTAVEFTLYAVLAPAVPLLVRRRADVLLVLGTLVAWSTVATAVGLAQWLGARILDAWTQGDRQPSFLGPHDFAALSGMVLLAGIVGSIWARNEKRVRRGAWVAVIVGAIGFVLGGATAGIVGLVPAAAVVVGVAARKRLLARRTLAVTLTTVAVASLGIVVLRARDFDQFFRFVGAKPAQTSSSQNIQTYSQRTLLAYIGVRVWLDHPIVGAGWQGSTEPSVVGQTLPVAHRRFPHLAARAFPGPGHEYGIQILYLQALADLGVVGFALLVGWLGTPAVTAARAALRAPPGNAWIPVLGLAWLLLSLGLWTAIGLVAGIPLDAVGWLAIGTIAAGSAASTPERSGTMRT